jgi:poly(3-hydroxybutyrate) depolymerase
MSSFSATFCPRRADAPGRAGRSAAIKDVAILAIEGERDDISGLGQTKAALKISTGLPKR